MKYLKAILATLSLMANVTLAPVFMQWYTQQTGIEDMANIGMFLVFFLLAAGQIAVSVIFWISALKDQSIKEIIG